MIGHGTFGFGYIPETPWGETLYMEYSTERLQSWGGVDPFFNPISAIVPSLPPSLPEPISTREDWSQTLSDIAHVLILTLIPWSVLCSDRALHSTPAQLPGAVINN